MPNASTSLLHALLDRGDYFESFSTAELQKLLPILEKANDEVLGKIAKTGGAWTKEWLSGVKADLDDIYGGASATIEKRLQPDLENLAKTELDWTAKTTGDILAGISITTPNAKALWASITALPAAGGSTLGQLMQALGVDASAQVVEAIQLGMAESETNDQMIRRIRGTVVSPAQWVKDASGQRIYRPGVYEGGVMEGATTRSAGALVRTATAYVGNQAREALYQENKDIIKGYQRVETLDLGTCLICGIDDGHVYGLDDPRPELPAHIDCRGLYVPVLKSFRELGFDVDLPPSTRASMDGQVPEYETWADRVAKASPDRRIAMLGPGRAALYARGMKLQDMVRDGQVVPLKDLGRIKLISPAAQDPFTPAASVKEATKWAEAHGIADKVMYGKLPLEVVNEMNRTLYETYAQFPEIRDQMQVYGSRQAIRKDYVDRRTSEIIDYNKDLLAKGWTRQDLEKMAKKEAEKEFPRVESGNLAISFSGGGVNGIGMNEIVCRDMKLFRRNMKNNVANGFHPPACDNITSIIDHEIGHRIDNLLGRISGSPELTEILGEEGKAKYIYLYDHLSGYASDSYAKFQGNPNRRNAETIAEAWSEYRNNPHPRTLAKKIGDWLIQKYKEWAAEKYGKGTEAG